MEPPQGPSAPTAPSDKAGTKSAKQERKRQRREEQRKAKEAKEVEAVPSDSDAEVEMLEAPLAKDELSFLRNLGVTPLEKTVEVSKLFALPQPLKASDDPVKEVAQLSGVSGSKDLEEAESNVNLYQQMLDENKAIPGRAHLSGVLEKNLKEWKEKVTKISKDQAGSPTVDKAVLSDLRAKKSTDEAKEDHRLASCEAKAKIARSRYDRLRNVLVNEQSKLGEKLNALDAQFVKTQEAWSLDATTRATFFQQKMAAWDSRISAATPTTGAMQQGQQQQQQLQQAAVPVAAATPSQQAACNGVLPNQTHNPQADYQLSTKWVLAEIPQPDIASLKADVTGLSLLLHNVQYWAQCGMFPMTFTQMYHGCENTDPLLVTHTLVGDTIWKRLYGDRQVLTDHVVPIQLVTVLTTALGKIEDEFKADTKRTELIEQKFDKFYEEGLEDKKVGQGVYGVDPY